MRHEDNANQADGRDESMCSLAIVHFSAKCRLTLLSAGTLTSNLRARALSDEVGPVGGGEHIVVYYFRLSKGASFPRSCARAIVLSSAVVLTMKTDAAIRIKLTEWCLLGKGEASSGQDRKTVVFVADGILNDGKILWTA